MGRHFPFGLELNNWTKTTFQAYLYHTLAVISMTSVNIYYVEDRSVLRILGALGTKPLDNDYITGN